MDLLITTVGIAGAAATASANLPQVLKSWRTGDTESLSIKMLLLLNCGFVCWIVYGLFRGDAVIVIANIASLALSLTLTWLKFRHGWR